MTTRVSERASSSVSILYENRLRFVAFLVSGLSGMLAFFRYREVNPVILQDEWIYVISSQSRSIWDNSGEYDFGNYIFDLVFRLTALCGPEFYTCAKLLNALIFSTFVFVIFLCFSLLVKPLYAIVGAAATGVSPLAAYTSMYLPEMLYFLFLAAAFYFLLKEALGPFLRNWIWIGGLLALAHLTKPHALFAVAASGIILVLFSLPKVSIRNVARSIGYFVGAFFTVRFALGFLLGGPRGLDILAAYSSGSAVAETVTNLTNQPTSGGLVGAGGPAGVFGLLPNMVVNHFLAFLSLAALGTLLIAAFLIAPTGSSWQRDSARRLAIIGAVWVPLMFFAIAAFTGWVTGMGDDHTTRLLLRYYEFLLPFVGVLGVGLAHRLSGPIDSPQPAWIRISLGLLVAGALSQTFTSNLWGDLTIQIADAPSIAGYIANSQFMNSIALFSIAAVLVFMFFPSFVRLAAPSLYLLVSVLTGIETHNQYSFARSEPNSADRAGQYLATNKPNSGPAFILASSRFDARIASFWGATENEVRLDGTPRVFDSEDLESSGDLVLSLTQAAFNVDDFCPSVFGDGFLLLTKVAQPGACDGWSLASLDAVADSQGFEFVSTDGAWMGESATINLANQGFDGRALISLTITGNIGTQGTDVSVSLDDGLVVETVPYELEPWILSFEADLSVDTDHQIVIKSSASKSDLEIGLGSSAVGRSLAIKNVQVEQVG